MITRVSRPDLPTGTVTFLFTDVEGSTRLLREHGSDYVRLLDDHRRVLRAAFQEYSGVEVDTQGDAFFVAFARATDAVAAAGEARRALEETPIRVRMGVHTGEPLLGSEGYVGIDVHRAARIAAAAHGGQIVVSETTRRLLGGDLQMRDLGEHRLKDLIGAEHLYQLGGDEFPPLRTLDATNLPVAATSLVGREREVEELVAELSNGTRLLTVTGPGGTGKTRLSLQVAAELVGSVRDGVFWVPLASVNDASLVESEIAQVIGAREDFQGFLRGKELVLLLDNLEHLLEAAPTVGSVLGASADIRILATSRSPLHISGEREYRLDPLPPADAVVLFVERARAAGSDVDADATVETICRRLDGLPLAVELAAARTKLLAPALLLERLDSAFSLLTGGPRDAPERQRTLRATIEWSYELLDEPAKQLFSQLAVFEGSFGLEAAEQVCDAAIDDIAVLVDSSLLKAVEGTRFLMLETIHEYALEHLARSGEGDALRQAHAEFFLALSEVGYERRFDEEAEWSARLASDHDDLRAALDWLEANEPDRALELAGALGWFWLSHGFLEEGGTRIADALAGSARSDAVRARALTASGALTGRLGDVARGRADLERAIEAWIELGDLAELAAALDSLAWLLFFIGDEHGALAAFERSRDLWMQLGDGPGETRALVGICQVRVGLGDVEQAESLAKDLLAAARGDLRTEHFALHFLADCSLIRGDATEAATRYRGSLEAALPLGDVLETSFEVQGVAMAASGLGDHRRALVLAAAVEALWESLGLSPSVEFWDALLERYIGAARDALGADSSEAWAAGRELMFEDAVALALTDG